VKAAIGLFLAICAIGVVILWMADPFNLRSPYDEALFTVFRDHRQSFENLRRMATEDARQESYFSESSLGVELGQLRQQEYKNEISQIFPGLVVTVDSNKVRFIFASGGLSAISGGWLKGIEYLPEGQEKQWNILTNLAVPIHHGNAVRRQ
jgi:hypothetical protein